MARYQLTIEFWERISFVLTIAFSISLVEAGSMRNYTGVFHPAGGADPKYLNYGAGVDVPHLVNPRIPRPGISLTPKHHLERFIGIKPGSMMDNGYMGEYYDDDDDYYEEEEHNDVIYPDVIRPVDFVTSDTENSRENQKPRRIQTIILQNDENDDSDEEIDDGIGNEDESDYDDSSLPWDDGSFPAESIIHCRDGRNGYRTGEVFTLVSDPCIQCTCSPLGPKCNKTRCDSLPPSCLELRREVDQCCPFCVKQGCTVGNVTFNVGESIQVTRCQTCRCEEDGRSYCSVADCTPPMCVDSITSNGECCPVCPNGPNCYTSNLEEVIPARVEWVPLTRDRCTICRCRRDTAGLQLWMGHEEAECKQDPSCRNHRNYRLTSRKEVYP